MNGTTIFSVESWLRQLERLHIEGRCNAPDFLKPHHFVTLALTCSRPRPGHTAAQPVLPSALEGYASRMRLWHVLGHPSPVDVTARDPGGRFVPLTGLTSANRIDDAATDLANIARTYGADNDTYQSLLVVMQELMGNCFAHASVTGPLHGVACAQSWPRANLVQIAIADRGVGIRRSLSENGALSATLLEGNSCEIATEFGVTSKPGKGHAGYGLALARQLIESVGGRIVVASKTEWFSAHGQRTDEGTMATSWDGTIVLLEWDTRRPLRTRPVYESWPLPEGYSDDDFNFD